jgi:PAP2 superfamily
MISALACWAVSWNAGFAPLPHLSTHVVLAFAGLGAAWALQRILRPRSDLPAWPSLVIGTSLIGLASSLFLPLKFAIPQSVPFWLDAPLAAADRALFRTDPWQILDHYLGWAAVPLDWIYGLWLPTQLLVMFTVMLAPPSSAKSRALVAYSLAWLLLGVICATLFSSVGPIFHDRVLGGSEFAHLGETLRARGAAMAIFESDTMWLAFNSGDPGLVAGISAFPSLHVAISMWIVLATRTMAPRLAALAVVYFALISLGSVQLGWHYVGDGIGGALGMLAVWKLAALVNRMQLIGLPALRLGGSGLRGNFQRRYLDLLGSIYIYNEHRGYTAIDGVLEAVRKRWPDDRAFIARIAKHREDERKHYLMFRRWFEQRGVMPFAVDRTCGHIDRFVGIMFRSTIKDLDPQLLVNRGLFARLCRVISLTEQRGHRQVEILLRHPIVRSDRRLIKIFTIIEEDEPSHWQPYDAWLSDHGQRMPTWWERGIDALIHSEMLFVKLPWLFLNRNLARRSDWPDELDAGTVSPAAAKFAADASDAGLALAAPAIGR